MNTDDLARQLRDAKASEALGVGLEPVDRHRLCRRLNDSEPAMARLLTFLERFGFGPGDRLTSSSSPWVTEASGVWWTGHDRVSPSASVHWGASRWPRGGRASTRAS